MLEHNKTYKSRIWFWTDPHIIQIEPGNCPYDWIEKIGNLLAGSKTLFLYLFGNENRASERSRDSLSLVTNLIQESSLVIST